MVVLHVFRFTTTKATVILKASDMALYSCSDLCLTTILSLKSTECSLDFKHTDTDDQKQVLKLNVFIR